MPRTLKAYLDDGVCSRITSDFNRIEVDGETVWTADTGAPSYRKAKADCKKFLSDYQERVVSYTENSVDRLVGQDLMGFVPESVEDGIRGVQEFIANALDTVREETGGAIDARAPAAFSKRRFSYFDAGVVEDTRNQNVVEFRYSYSLIGLGSSTRVTSKSSSYKVDVRYWDARKMDA